MSLIKYNDHSEFIIDHGYLETQPARYNAKNAGIPCYGWLLAETKAPDLASSPTVLGSGNHPCRNDVYIPCGD
jgi:hypothetical protein